LIEIVDMRVLLQELICGLRLLEVYIRRSLAATQDHPS